jgi:hypothetical protein
MTDAQLRDIAILKHYLDNTADADWVALGYTEAEVTTLKSAAADLIWLTDPRDPVIMTKPPRDRHVLIWMAGAAVGLSLGVLILLWLVLQRLPR